MGRWIFVSSEPGFVLHTRVGDLQFTQHVAVTEKEEMAQCVMESKEFDRDEILLPGRDFEEAYLEAYCNGPGFERTIEDTGVRTVQHTLFEEVSQDGQHEKRPELRPLRGSGHHEIVRDQGGRFKS